MSGASRGQTTLDFTIGVTIFVVVLAGVFLFVPGTLEPFEEGGQENIVTVNRVADQLSQQSLVADPTTPYVLSDDCTEEFFGGPDADEECEYSGGSLQERIGFGDFQFLNVTIRGTGAGSGTDPLCYDDGEPPGSRLESSNSCDSDQTRLAVGQNLVGVQSSVTARRVVELDGQEVFLVVQVW